MNNRSVESISERESASKKNLQVQQVCGLIERFSIEFLKKGALLLISRINQKGTKPVVIGRTLFPMLQAALVIALLTSVVIGQSSFTFIFSFMTVYKKSIQTNKQTN